jgi:hypothetical protein
VNDPLRVSGGQAADDLQPDFDRLARRKRAAFEALAKGRTLEQLHRGVHDAVLASEVVDREDVRVRQRRDGSRLALETRERIGVSGERLGKNLDRDIPAELRVFRPVDFAHPARSERRKDLVGTEPGAGGETHFTPSTVKR